MTHFLAILPYALVAFFFGCVAGYWRCHKDMSLMMRGKPVPDRKSWPLAILALAFIAYLAYLGCLAL